jgi:hypothetical protein
MSAWKTTASFRCDPTPQSPSRATWPKALPSFFFVVVVVVGIIVLSKCAITNDDSGDGDDDDDDDDKRQYAIHAARLHGSGGTRGDDP